MAMPTMSCRILVLLVVGSLLNTSLPESKYFTVAADTGTDADADADASADEEHVSDSEFVCNAYLAPSTLPGSGLGVFAGAKGYKKGEILTKTLGDHIIPIVDMKMFQADDRTGIYDASNKTDRTKYFIVDQYTWNVQNFGMGMHLTTGELDIVSPGIGAVGNCAMDFVNVEEGDCELGLLPSDPTKDEENETETGWGSWSSWIWGKTEEDEDKDSYHIHRSKDPGAGAFTPSHTRMAWAEKDIAPNSELFISYGNSWFLKRVHQLGTIPVEGDHDTAAGLWEQFNKDFLGRRNNNLDSDGKDDDDDGNDDELVRVHREFWDTIVATHVKNTYTTSRIFAALPKDAASEEYDAMLTHPGGYKGVKQEKMRRSPEWLAENGVCADAVRIGRSTLPNQQAGHGAFAKTFFDTGAVILSAPLLHIPNKAILDTYYKNDDLQQKMEAAIEFGHDEAEDIEKASDRGNTRDKKNMMKQFEPGIGNIKTGEQLLLNYAYGHRDSTMILCAYGPGVQLINHNQTLANARLQWAEPHRSNHHPHLLTKSVAYIQQNFPMESVLGLEIVATKPIHKDEEIFLDYGDEWEEAWQKHLQQWEPLKGSDRYLSAIDLNTLPKYTRKPLPNIHDTHNTTELAALASHGGANGNGNGDIVPYPRTVRLRMDANWVNATLREAVGDDAIIGSTKDFLYEVLTIVRSGTSLVDKHKFYKEDPKLWASLTPEQKQIVREEFEKDKAKAKAKAAGNPESDVDADTNVDSDSDPSLYTVVARMNAEYRNIDMDEAKSLIDQLNKGGKTNDIVTVLNVPRRGLKFEDLSYTTDQFLSNAFREYIRIPDDIFPDAWKNIQTPQQKHAHYWKYRTEGWQKGGGHRDIDGDAESFEPDGLTAGELEDNKLPTA